MCYVFIVLIYLRVNFVFITLCLAVKVVDEFSCKYLLSPNGFFVFLKMLDHFLSLLKLCVNLACSGVPSAVLVFKQSGSRYAWSIC